MRITDYTHKRKRILDIRLKKGKSDEKFFAIIVEGINSTLYVNYDIFNDRIKSFFLGKNVEEINRYDLLNLEWNFIITQGYFYKITDKAFIKQISNNKNKWFVSVLEIFDYWSDYERKDDTSLADFEKAFGTNVTTIE
jgi:hypothetical protein